MKNRVLCLLLSLCLVFTLLCGLTMTASADTTSYTLQSGDTVIDVCKKLGIDFYANRAWIVQQNNITSFNNLPAGMTLILPTGDAAKGGAAKAASTTTTVTGATVVTADTVAYYLVNHTMRSGEAVINVCKSLGVDFLANQSLISSINGITNYKGVQVNQVIKIPTYTVPTNGDSYSKVVAHKVVKGDTVGDLCRNYGIDYASNKNAIQGLNGLTNLGVIYEGQTLLLPVSSSVVIGSASAGGTGSTVVTTPSDAANTDPNAVIYKIYNGGTEYYDDSISAYVGGGGSFTVKSGSTALNKAAAGASLKVVCSPDVGYQVKSIKVLKYEGGNEIAVKADGSFTMPNFDVKVKVEFAKVEGTRELSVSIVDGAANVFCMVGDDKVEAFPYKTTEGVNVKIYADPFKGYEIDTIKAYETGKDKHTLVITDNSFIMPNFDVTVEVKLKNDSAVEIKTVYDDTMGTLGFEGTYEEGGKIMSAAGEKVTVLAAPFSNCKVTDIQVYYESDNSKVVAKGTKDTLTFEVPKETVVVKVTFVNKPAFEITKVSDPTAGGEFDLTGTFKEGTKIMAYEGSKVTIKTKCFSGYTVKGITVVDTSSSTVSKDETTFTMPKSPVTVTVRFTQADKKVLVKSPATGGAVSAKADGIAIDAVQSLRNGASGEFVTLKDKTVEISAKPDVGWELDAIKVTKTGEPGYVVKNDKETSFKTPNFDVTVEVTFKEQKNHAFTLNVVGDGEVVATIDGEVQDAVKAPGNTWAKVYKGKTVKLSTKAYDGYKLESVKATETDISLSSNAFTMPDHDATITVTFVQIKESNVNLEVKTDVAADGGEISVTVDGALMKSGLKNGSYTLDPDYIIHDVQKGQTVKVTAVKYAGFLDPIVKVEPDPDNGKTVTVTKSSNVFSFTMPSFPVKVTVTFEENKKQQEYTVSAESTADVYTLTVSGLTTADNSDKLVTAGTTVTVNPIFTNPDIQTATITVFKKGMPTSKVTMDGKSFTMPTYDVEVRVVYGEKVNNKLDVVVDGGHGQITKVSYDGEMQTDTPTSAWSDSGVLKGTVVTFSTVRDEGYKKATYSIEANPANGKTPSIDKDTGEFTMPNYPVKVTIKFALDEKQVLRKIEADPTNDASVIFSMDIGGANYAPPKTDVKPGTSVKIFAETSDANMKVDSIQIIDQATGTVLFSSTSATKTFEMPKADVYVKVNLVAK